MKAPWGHNKRLHPNEVKRAVLAHLQAEGQRYGKDVPADLIDFMNKADLILLDQNNQPVHFVRAIVAWEED